MAATNCNSFSSSCHQCSNSSSCHMPTVTHISHVGNDSHVSHGSCRAVRGLIHREPAAAAAAAEAATADSTTAGQERREWQSQVSAGSITSTATGHQVSYSLQPNAYTASYPFCCVSSTVVMHIMCQFAHGQGRAGPPQAPTRHELQTDILHLLEFRQKTVQLVSVCPAQMFV